MQFSPTTPLVKVRVVAERELLIPVESVLPIDLAGLRSSVFDEVLVTGLELKDMTVVSAPFGTAFQTGMNAKFEGPMRSPTFPAFEALALTEEAGRLTIAGPKVGRRAASESLPASLRQPAQNSATERGTIDVESDDEIVRPRRAKTALEPLNFDHPVPDLSLDPEADARMPPRDRYPLRYLRDPSPLFVDETPGGATRRSRRRASKNARRVIFEKSQPPSRKAAAPSHRDAPIKTRAEPRSSTTIEKFRPTVKQRSSISTRVNAMEKFVQDSKFRIAKEVKYDAERRWSREGADLTENKKVELITEQLAQVFDKP